MRVASMLRLLRQHRDTAISVGVLTLAVCVCVPLLVVLPDSRPYGATVIAWTLAFAVRAWRWLPWERAHERRAAHRLADARMRLRGVGKVLLPYSDGNACASSQPSLRCRGFHTVAHRSPAPRRLALGDRAAVDKEMPITTTTTPSSSSSFAVAAAAAADTCLSASALESSAQFLALAQVAERPTGSWPVATRHSTSAPTSWASQQDDGSATWPSHEPFSHAPRGAPLVSSPLSPRGDVVPSHTPASPSSSSTPPPSVATSCTRGYTGQTATPASRPPTPAVVDSAAEGDAFGADPDAEVGLRVPSQMRERAAPPPTYEEAMLSSRNSSSPRIAVLHSTMRVHRFTASVARDAAA
ncbi:hypothetical protein NESM_000536800 [Novymonas esmeraldas]|uniref:Uncharacterized protein n=1 Tax=Novymonas esmeraldas TaxID=1808958 RepID=A0AAW0ERY9_9TRYP